MATTPLQDKTTEALQQDLRRTQILIGIWIGIFAVFLVIGLIQFFLQESRPITLAMPVFFLPLFVIQINQRKAILAELARRNTDL